MSLAKIVEDVINDRATRRRFVQNPDELIYEYGLTPAERSILLTMLPDEVKKHVPNDVKAMIDSFKVSRREFPPGDEDFLAEQGGLEPQYPTPEPNIFRYRIHPPFKYYVDPGPPRKVQRGFSADEINNSSSPSIELTVFGQSYLEASLELVRDVKTPTPADYAVQQADTFFILGSFRNTVLRAVFTAPGSANAPADWVAGQSFVVRVTNLNGAGTTAVKDAAIRLTVLT